MIGKRHTRRWAAWTLSVLLIIGCLALAPPRRARAFIYQDETNQIRIDVPEGRSIYYYTPIQSNLFEDLAEQVQNSGRDVRVLVRAYTDQDLLGYSLEVAAVPAPGSIPAGGGVPQGSNLRDAQLLDDSGKSLAEATVRMAYEGRFNFSSPTNGKLGDINALLMRGTGVDGTGWAPYDCDVYLIATTGDMLMVSLIYESNASNEYRDEGFALLNSLAVGPAALAEPTATSVPQQSASEQPATQVATLASGTPGPRVTRNEGDAFSSFFPNLWASVQAFWQQHAPLCYSAIAAIVAIVVFAVARSHKKRAKEQAEAAEKLSAAKARAEAKAEAARARVEIAQAEADARAREERQRRALEKAEREQKERAAQGAYRQPEPRKSGTRRQIGVPAPQVTSAESVHPRGTRRRILPPPGQERESTRPIPPTQASERRMREWERAAEKRSATLDLRVEPAEELRQAQPEETQEPPTDNQIELAQAGRSSEPMKDWAADNELEDEFYEEEQADMGADEQREYRGRNYDYTEDVSRYTQQPGPEVNDVSRYTHGGYSNEPNELDSLKDLPYGSQAGSDSVSRPTRRPSVGSRVEKNRSRKKRR